MYIGRCAGFSVEGTRKQEEQQKQRKQEEQREHEEQQKQREQEEQQKQQEQEKQWKQWEEPPRKLDTHHGRNRLASDGPELVGACPCNVTVAMGAWWWLGVPIS